MKRCYACMSERLITACEDYVYSEFGCKNIVLKNVPVTRCQSCKDLVVSIFSIYNLHKCIGLALSRKRSLDKRERKTLETIGQPLTQSVWSYRRRGRLIECFQVESAESSK